MYKSFSVVGYYRIASVLYISPNTFPFIELERAGEVTFYDVFVLLQSVLVMDCFSIQIDEKPWL